MIKRGYVITREMVSKGKNKEKTSRWSKIKSNATILISLGALVISGWVGYSNNKRAQYLESTNFNIIQNFWQDSPSFMLYNESQKPLTSPPKPSYFMYIPAKLYYILKDRSRFSILIMLPVSYDNIISQSGSGKTIDTIQTSVLPNNFYGKLGGRDMKSMLIGEPEKDEIAYEIRVYPYLAIATNFDYSYKDNPSKKYTESFISTPWNKTKLSDKRYRDLIDYSKNIAHFQENEIKVNGNESIYDTAFKYLSSEFKHLLNNKDLSQTDKEKLYSLQGIRWDIDQSSRDYYGNFENNMKNSSSFEEFQSKLQNDSNFNGLGKFLSEKVVPVKDPLYPDY